MFIYSSADRRDLPSFPTRRSSGLLVRHGHPAVAEAFLATRLGGQWGGAYGTNNDPCNARQMSSAILRAR
ncbi:hypothetical protein FVP46_08290 [Mycobacterium tuberculosis]|nr:hypothetical protein [Mycobacterium tuberculosis]